MPVNFKHAKKHIDLLILFVVFVCAGYFPYQAHAQATLYISPAAGAYKVGELFSVIINANSGGHSINAASGQVNFDNHRLEISSIGFSRSIFTIWTEEPSFSNVAGSIKFSGGLPAPGFIGSSGDILRVTFKAKATGQAQIVFVSGSVLANDGNGTNILDSLKGASYNVIASTAPPSPTPSPVILPVSETKPTFETADKSISAPTITDWPKELEAGQTLNIKGLGYPSGKILISVQKGSDDPMVEERFVGTDGRFSYNFNKIVETGIYRVWAKNVTADGLISLASEIVLIEISAPLFFRIGTIAVNYASIILTLLALILALVLLLFYIWHRIRKWQKRQGRELSEAENTLHEAFEKMQTGLRRYILYLTASKSAEEIRRREAETERDLNDQLKEIKTDLEKEIKDIANPPKEK